MKQDKRPSDLLPYDSLASNREDDSSQMYFDRSNGKKRLDVATDPRKDFNSPTWMKSESRTTANEGTAEKNMLSRTVGGINVFARKKKHEQEQHKHHGRKTANEGEPEEEKSPRLVVPLRRY